MERYSSMNREELRAQIQAAALRLTDELVEYFGEMLQSVVKDVTVGVTEAKPLRKATPPPAPPKKVAPKKAKAAPKAAAPKKIVVKKAAKVAPPKAAPKKAAPKKVAPKKAAPKKAAPKKAAPKKAAPAPKAAKAKKEVKAAKAAPVKKAAKAAPKSGRRSIKELDLAADVVVKFLKDQGRGMRIEEINKALGTSTRELMRPIKKLLGNKKIQKRGERRSTTYFAS